MGSFSLASWKKEANRRRKHALTEGKSPVGVERRHTNDLRFAEALSKVVKWCRKANIEVDFVSRSDGSYDPVGEIIVVGRQLSYASQLFTLLHEVGHFLVNSTEKHERFAHGYRNMDPSVAGTTINRLDILEEEFEAWARGWFLGLHLNILKKEDRPAFDKFRVNSLREYVKWCLKTEGVK